MDKDLLLLRRHWLAFAFLVLLGIGGELWLPASQRSAGELYQLHPRHYWLDLQVATHFGLLVAATYLNRQWLWWLAIYLIGSKLYWLLAYYAFFDYEQSSGTFNYRYLSFPYRLSFLASKWLGILPELLFGNNPLSAAFLTTLYVYWLVLCTRMLRALAARPPAHPAQAR